MRKGLFFLLGALILGLLLTGYFPRQSETSANQPDKPSTPIMVARYTEIPVVIDGKLDDPIWRKTPTYQMKPAKYGHLHEEGEVQLAWDDDYLYVAVKFYDSDIVAELKEDQAHHYLHGDVMEVFLKPEDQTWYWELYATPAGNKSSFFFPGKGRLGLQSCFEYTCGLKVAAQVEGTLNHWQDEDGYWTAEMAMPIEDLTLKGVSLEPGTRWRILVARYNYSRYIPLYGAELSMAPQMTVANFHLHDQYADLHLE